MPPEPMRAISLNAWCNHQRGDLTRRFIFLPFGHTVAHVYWLVDLREYHPGTVTAVLLITPLMLYVGAQLVRERLVSVWYLAFVFLLSVPQSLGDIWLDYRIPDEGLPHYQLSSWLVSLVS